MKRGYVIVGCILLALAVVVVNISRKRESGSSQPQKKPPEVRVAIAGKTTISRVIELTGSVEPWRVAMPGSPAEGPVLKMRVREGDRVRAGDLLLSIGRKEGIDALIISLREELRKEEDNLKNTERLVEERAFPMDRLDEARADYERVRAQLAKAEESARDYAITAPWNGVVSRLLVKEGSYVSPRSPLIEIYDPASLVINTAVPERFSADLKPGMDVSVHLDAYPADEIMSRITRIYPYLDERMRTRTIEIEAPSSVDLIPGMFARLKVKLKTVDDAVVVPVEAVVNTKAGTAVFVVKDGKAVRCAVVTGLEEAGRVEIVSGLEPGDKVVTAGNDKIKDGAAVRVPGDKKDGDKKASNNSKNGNTQSGNSGTEAPDNSEKTGDAGK